VLLDCGCGSLRLGFEGCYVLSLLVMRVRRRSRYDVENVSPVDEPNNLDIRASHHI
jgi:hypothetical protein